MAKQFDRGRDYTRCNEQIRVPKVLVVRDNVNLGIMFTSEALKKARADGMDLVEIAAHAKPPVCAILDYGKYMYEKQKKKKETKAATTKEKEISFRYVIDDHDLETKANQARKFLEKGSKVKLVVKFKAREKAHKDQGFLVMNRCLEMLSDIAEPERPPAFEGATLMVRVDRKKAIKEKQEKSDQKPPERTPPT